MGQYQRVLLIADRTLYQSPALQRAVALAKVSGAILDVRAFIEPAPIIHLWEEKTDEAEFNRRMHWPCNAMHRCICCTRMTCRRLSMAMRPWSAAGGTWTSWRSCGNPCTRRL